MKEEFLEMTEIEELVKKGKISLINVIKTQKLTMEFCRDYILDKDDKYCLTEMDKYITLSDILSYQKHLKRSDFDS
tara:strand:- start:4042 stop:4269 length:228 start_codon:yes stop_codon:yes gene_type:complete